MQEDRPQVVTFEEGTSVEKIQLEEGKRQIASKKPPVNLAAIQKLLQLSDKRINSFLSLYPPLKKIPTPTHEATIELLWAEVCDRKWPVTNDHHLTFANFADIYTWKTNSAKFCAHMAVGKDITPYIIDLSTEGGCSLWVRKTAGGTIIFKREILEGPFLCLDDYHKADRQAQKAAGHVLTGCIQIPLENQIQTIRCVSLVNLNPKKGATISDKTGFDRALIRRLIPCNLDAIELPDLKKIGEEALDAAKNFGSLKMEKPTSSCREYRKELIHYYEKLFTEEGQDLIDIDGLLNIARGFTGYGFTPSEAVRYTLYKASLPYHTVGWLRPEWVEGFRKEKPTAKIRKMLTPRMKTGKESTQIPVKTDKKELETLRDTIKFQEEHEDELSKLKKLATEIEQVKKFLEREGLSWDRINQLLLEKGYQVPSPERCQNALQVVNKKYKAIQDRDWTNLKNLKRANYWLNETYIKPLTEAKRRIKIYKKVSDQIWDWISNAKKISQISTISRIIDESPLAPSQKHRLKEITDEKQAALEKEKQSKIEELVSYLREMKELGDSYNYDEKYEKMKKLGRDITEELVQLEFIKKENGQLRGKDGQIYALDAFNLPQHADTFLSFVWKDACCQGLTLLTGVKHKTLAEERENFSFSSSREERKKEEIPTWAKWALGLGGLGIVGVKVGNEIVNHLRSKKLQTVAKTQPIPPSPQEPIAPQRLKEESKLGVTSETKREPKIVTYPQKYYKGHPVEIIDQTEYRYTIRDATGKDISVPKNEVIFKK